MRNRGVRVYLAGILALVFTVHNGVGATQTYNKVLFYGDSISDNGAYTATGSYADQTTAAAAFVRQNQLSHTDPTRAAIAGAPLENLGENDNDGVTGYSSRVAPFAPNYLVIELGTNDYLYSTQYHLTLSSYAAAWEQLYAEIAAQPVPPTRIVVLGMRVYALPFGGTLPRWAVSVADAQSQLNAVSLALAVAHHATYVSVDSLSSSDMQSDLIHPTATGQNKIAAALIPVFVPPVAVGATHVPGQAASVTASPQPPLRVTATSMYTPATIATQPSERSVQHSFTAVPMPQPQRH